MIQRGGDGGWGAIVIAPQRAIFPYLREVWPKPITRPPAPMRLSQWWSHEMSFILRLTTRPPSHLPSRLGNPQFYLSLAAYGRVVIELKLRDRRFCSDVPGVTCSGRAGGPTTLRRDALLQLSLLRAAAGVDQPLESSTEVMETSNQVNFQDDAAARMPVVFLQLTLGMPHWEIWPAGIQHSTNYPRRSPK